MLKISYSISFVDFGSLTTEEKFTSKPTKLIDNTYTINSKCEYTRVLDSANDGGYDFSKGITPKNPGVMLLPLIKVQIK